VDDTFRAEIRFSAEDSPQQKRLIAEALRTEAETLPRLLEYGSRATLVASGPNFEVQVRVRGSRYGAAAVGTFALVTFLSLIAYRTSLGHGIDSNTWLIAGGLCSLTLLVGLALRSDENRRRQSRVQSLRILALERESNLRRERPREISRPQGEPILAGQYRIGEPLGFGGSGAVWRAIRLKDGVPVALKLIRAGVAHDVRATDRLRREAEALGLAWHPNVVEIYESGLLVSGVAYLAMERLYGESLAERLLRAGPVSYAEGRRIALELADALIAIHSAGVVHRDIKPANLFLHRGRASEEGEASDEAPGEPSLDRVSPDEARLSEFEADDSGAGEVGLDSPKPTRSPPSGTSRTRATLKLIDFGVARITWAETRLTRSGMRIGTLGYAAPEQERGEDVDGRADLYAAGITLLECLTGRSPPGHSSLGQNSLMQDSLANVVLLPAEFAALIASLTQDDPNLRPLSAREFRDRVLRLPKFAGGQPGPLPTSAEESEELPESSDRPSPRPRVVSGPWGRG